MTPHTFQYQLHELVLRALENGVAMAEVVSRLELQAEVLETLHPYHVAIVSGRAAP